MAFNRLLRSLAAGSAAAALLAMLLSCAAIQRNVQPSEAAPTQ